MTSIANPETPIAQGAPALSTQLDPKASRAFTIDELTTCIKVLEGIDDADADEDSNEVFERLKAFLKKDSEDDVPTDSLISFVLANLNRRSFNAGVLEDISHCRTIIPRLSVLCPRCFSAKHVPAIADIHGLNPNIKWYLSIDDGFPKQDLNFQLPEGLKGNLDSVVYTKNTLDKLEAIFTKSHSDLTLHILMNNAESAEVQVQNFIDRTVLLQHLVKLTLITPTEEDMYALEKICENFDFDLDLRTNLSYRFLQSCKLAISRTVHLELVSATEDDVYWAAALEGQPGLSFIDVETVRHAAPLVHSRSQLHCICIDTPLDSEGVALFKQICKAHPNVVFNITLERAGLVEPLQGLPMGVTIMTKHDDNLIHCSAGETANGNGDYDDNGDSLFNVQKATVLNCPLEDLPSFLDMDLSSLTELRLRIMGTPRLDGDLVRRISTSLPRLDSLLIVTSDWRESLDMYVD